VCEHFRVGHLHADKVVRIAGVRVRAAVAKPLTVPSRSTTTPPYFSGSTFG
jgi:hypothetical protein